MSGGEAVSLVSGQLAGVVHAACPPFWVASQAAGEIIPIAECRRMVLYSSIQAATRVLAAAWVGKFSTERSSNSRVDRTSAVTQPSPSSFKAMSPRYEGKPIH
jgi:hypothetical protein